MMVRAEGLLERLCHMLSIGRLVEVFGFLMMRFGVMSGCWLYSLTPLLIGDVELASYR
jgi:hypothetical protein